MLLFCPISNFNVSFQRSVNGHTFKNRSRLIYPINLIKECNNASPDVRAKY